ncbi:MAG TPA: tRNA (adenosine(37)-N6)-threonylcarbamoyltransferase complex ATPase subunit type 1 TsaE [Candidatus Choladousia intestinavium]|uniref:tRNA threonylcarbamoyladenosine biosynthesis protein TsaE n=1 Tax=Candidatus Choladousia intestinavium TaxID=2840727 RepID=A0A9D1D9W8_9FIRM|nr:tRNA (adenosine(37)-N6)-threonylcarbamoyltransferase complex ATPase subunit type 1 TsaE [Candidatus Choladousia intestinavium]
MEIETYSEKETYRLGEILGQKARPGQVYSLSGDLGTGKTVLTQGMAAGLGILEPVNSPTFTILQVYEEGRMPFYHFDVYRIGDLEEMEEIGYEDCFYGEGISLVEWGDLIRELMPPETVWISIEKDLEKGFDYRKIRIRGLETDVAPGKGTAATEQREER